MFCVDCTYFNRLSYTCNHPNNLDLDPVWGTVQVKYSTLVFKNLVCKDSFYCKRRNFFQRLFRRHA